MALPNTIALADDHVVILDQQLLPWEARAARLKDIHQVWMAIKNLQVRGAPAVGIAGAMGLYIHMKKMAQPDSSFETLCEIMERGIVYLNSSRPTAANLNWALLRMKESLLACSTQSAEQIIEGLRQTALLIQAEDEQVCAAIGKHGCALISKGMGILTYCNAGALATSKYGTALAPIYFAHEAGLAPRVYACETRPVLQGARLTTFELAMSGVDVTLICDNMAATCMARGLVDIVLVGCDRVAANGDAANKVGTMGVAILAKNFNIPFYVCAPFSTIDTATPTGAQIIIEERDGDEITDMWFSRPVAGPSVKTLNPAFDVTPAAFVTGYITEKGIVQPPFVG